MMWNPPLREAASAIPYGLGLGVAIWLPMNWSRWKRGLW